MGVFITDKDGKLKKVAGNSGSGLPIGSIFSSAIPQTDARVHLLDGSTILQSGVYETFANLIKALVAGGHNIVYEDDEELTAEQKFTADVTATGNCGKFIIDNVNGTIRLPKITTFIQGLSSITNIGSSLSAGLPNITGVMNNNWTSSVSYSGALYAVGVGSANRASTGSSNAYNMGFDASLSNSIYGNSNTVQPQATQYPYYIVLASGYKSDQVVDIDNIVTELGNKQDKLIAGNGISINNGVISSSNMKVLWTNPDPTASFSAQNITLNSSDYDYLLFEYKTQHIWNITEYAMCKKGTNARMYFIYNDSAYARYYIQVGVREASYISDTSYSVGNIVVFDLSGYSESNSRAVPVRVIGVKVV